MSLLSFFRGQKKTSASVARDRLQLILINERGDGVTPDYLPRLQKELVEVISRYVKINPDDIKVNLERQDSLEILDVKIEMPQVEGGQSCSRRCAAGAAQTVPASRPSIQVDAFSQFPYINKKIGRASGRKQWTSYG